MAEFVSRESNDASWLRKRLSNDEFLERYHNNWVAVQNEEVVAATEYSEFSELLSKFSDYIGQGESPLFCFVFRDGFQ